MNRWILSLLLFAPIAGATTDGRLLSMDSGEVIDRTTLGLQRSAVALPAGFAIDTSLIGDLALAANLGVRWAMATGPHHVAIGARYTQFFGAPVYSSAIAMLNPTVKQFNPSLSGPSAYAAYGIHLGQLSLTVEGRYEHLYYDAAGLNVGGSLVLGGNWWLVAEVGYRFFGQVPLHASLGVRFTGEHFGLALGATYTGYQDPQLPPLPVLPALDVFWCFG